MRLPVALLLTGVVAAALVAPPAGAMARDLAPVPAVSPLGCDRQPITGPCPDWVTTFASPTGGDQPDRAFETVMSSDGRHTFVTGASWDNATGADDITTLAVDTASGEVLWVATYGGGRDDRPTALALSPDGSTVFVAGTQNTLFVADSAYGDYATIAYDATTGHQLWAASYGAAQDGADAAQWSSAAAIAVHPDGSELYVTGTSGSTTLVADAVTLALDARTGEELWRSRFSGPTEAPPTYFSVVDLDGGSDVSVTPDGRRVVVAGFTYTESNRASYLVLAYDTADQSGGALLWSAVDDWDTATRNVASFVTASPDGESLFVVGEHDAATTPRAGVVCCSQSSAFGVIAYDADTGERLWRSTHRGRHGGITAPHAVATDPRGERLFVAGRANGPELLLAQAQTVAFDAATGGVAWDASYALTGAYFTTWADVVVSDDGTRVGVTGHGLGPNTVQMGTAVYDAATGSSTWSATYFGDPVSEPAYNATSLDMTPDGRGIVVAGAVGRPNDAEDRGDYAIMRYTVD